MATDWVAWHDQYAADGALVRRLEVVRRLIRTALDGAPPGEIRVVSMCAGDGRDLLGVLGDHPRRHEVRARLVELEPALAERARTEATRLELDGVEVVCGERRPDLLPRLAEPGDVDDRAVGARGRVEGDLRRRLTAGLDLVVGDRADHQAGDLNAFNFPASLRGALGDRGSHHVV